jgi:putative acetyltransferase
MSQKIPPPRIRKETPADHAATREVHLAAFPTPLEADLVDALRAAGHLTVSLLAVEGEAIVGHIAFSPVSTEKPALVSGVGLAPVAVTPAFERRGIGGELIRQGIQACKSLRFGWVVVLGDPAYYRRFGFDRASKFGIGNEYGVDEEFMVAELIFGSIPRDCGIVSYSPEFAVCGGHA